MSDYVIKYLQDQHEQNKKLLLKFDADLRMSRARLTAAKLMVTTIEQEMAAMRVLYHDLMELRQFIVLLNPHLQKTRYS